MSNGQSHGGSSHRSQGPGGRQHGSQGNRPQHGGGSGGGGQGGKSYGNQSTKETLKEIEWFASDNSIRPELFSETAQYYAEKLGAQDSKNENSQVRGFFDELIRIHMAIGNDEKKYKEQLPFLLMLRSKVYYSKGRKLVNDDFVDFMEEGLELSKKGLREFEIFVRFFEAFLGFFKYYKDKELRRY